MNLQPPHPWETNPKPNPQTLNKIQSPLNFKIFFGKIKIQKQHNTIIKLREKDQTELRSTKMIQKLRKKKEIVSRKKGGDLQKVNFFFYLFPSSSSSSSGVGLCTRSHRCREQTRQGREWISKIEGFII